MSTEKHSADPDVNVEELCPLDVDKIAHAQTEDKELLGILKQEQELTSKNNKRNYKYKQKFVNDVKVFTYEDRIYIPSDLREVVLNWYHHYLQHPGTSRMQNTLQGKIYWPRMSTDIPKLCTTCHICQIAKRLKDKYGKLPMKDLDMRHWHNVCVNCIGPFTIKVKDSNNKIHKRTIYALILIDPAT